MTSGGRTPMVEPVFWTCFAFVLIFGAVVGSFLNVVIYRLPVGQSIVHPPSRCPNCGRRLSWFDNVPVLAWCYLRGRCRTCGAAISVQYPLVEAVTSLLFGLTFWVLLVGDWRPNLAGLGGGAQAAAGAMVVAVHLALVGSLLAASLIDAKLYIIPLEIPWFATAVAVIGWPAAALWLPEGVAVDGPLRVTSVLVVAAAGGGVAGLVIANVLVRTRLLPRSFEGPPEGASPGVAKGQDNGPGWQQHQHPRREMCKELLFLVFPLAAAAAAAAAIQALGTGPVLPRWAQVLTGVALGYLVGGGLIWVIRILGTMAFGREAMGLGDVHLMAAVGAVLGAADAALVIFLTPFPALLLIAVVRGVGWMLKHHGREIPYGPYLSLTAVALMLGRQPIWAVISGIFAP